MVSSCDVEGSFLPSLLSLVMDDFLPFEPPAEALRLIFLLAEGSRKADESFFFDLYESRSSVFDDVDALRFDDDEEEDEDEALDRSNSALRPRNDAEMDPDEPEPPLDELVPLIVSVSLARLEAKKVFGREKAQLNASTDSTNSGSCPTHRNSASKKPQTAQHGTAKRNLHHVTGGFI